MPKCVKCNNFFHPDYSILMEKHNPQDPDFYQCTFCFLDKKMVTIIDEKTQKVVKTVLKEDARREYELYLKKLCGTGKIKELVTPKE